MGVRLATRNDRESISRFLGGRERRTCRGSIYVDREPDFFASFDTEGKEARILIAESALEGQVVGVGALSHRPAFLNGGTEPINTGYLGSLELEPGQWCNLRAGYALIRRYASAAACPVCLTTILAGNQHAKAVLSSRRLGLPEYRSQGTVTTILCTARALGRMRSGQSGSLIAERAGRGDCAEIDRFISEVGPSWQAFPAYSCADLSGSGFLPGARLENLLIVRDRAKIRGIGLLWDVERFKRWKVDSCRMSTFGRVARQMWLSIHGQPNIFATSHRICFLAARLVRPGDTEAFSTLLRAAAEALADGSVCFSLHERDPFLKPLSRLSALRFGSELFSVHFEGSAFKFDDRPFYLEAGAL